MFGLKFVEVFHTPKHIVRKFVIVFICDVFMRISTLCCNRYFAVLNIRECGTASCICGL